MFVNKDTIYNLIDVFGRFTTDMDGKRLRDVRMRLKMTQASLGEMLSTDARQIWRWENGESDPTGETLGKLAQMLDVSADYLLGLTDDPTPANHGPGLNTLELKVVEALRRGDRLEAVRAIVGTGS